MSGRPCPQFLKTMPDLDDLKAMFDRVGVKYKTNSPEVGTYTVTDPKTDGQVVEAVLELEAIMTDCGMENGLQFFFNDENNLVSMRCWEGLGI